jgi:uncharacterized membrane protein (DUF485 family)
LFIAEDSVPSFGKSGFDNPAAPFEEEELALAEDVVASAFAGPRNLDLDVPSAVLRIEEEWKSLVRPLLSFSSAFYIIGLIVMAYMPDVSAYKITGAINVAYVLALAQFVMTFVVAYIYARRADRLIDPLIAEAFAELSATGATGAAR